MASLAKLLHFFQRDSIYLEYENLQHHEIAYGFQPNYNRVVWEKTSDEDRKFCAICRDNIKYNKKRKTLDCQHWFHEKCINQWFQMRKTCPICRVVFQASDK